MTDDTDTPAGWTIVSIGDDGSVLCQSPSGHRRRYWFQVAELSILQAENERLRAALKVICTWGHMDIRQPEFTPRLVAEDVVALCDKALGND